MKLNHREIAIVKGMLERGDRQHDIAAYFGGRLFGGPKLWPAVSPKKTWSGALTGLAAAAIAGAVTVEVAHAASFLQGLAIAVPASPFQPDHAGISGEASTVGVIRSA